MKSKTLWTPSDLTNATSLRPFEFKDEHGDWQNFELLATKDQVVFGGCGNVGFIESGYILRDEYESLDETLAELVSDLRTYYNEGPNYVSRIVCNERM